MNSIGTLDRTCDLRGCGVTVIMAAHQQRRWPDLICQVLNPSKSDLLPVQPWFCGAQLASVFIHNLSFRGSAQASWINPAPLLPVPEGTRLLTHLLQQGIQPFGGLYGMTVGSLVLFSDLRLEKSGRNELLGRETGSEERCAPSGGFVEELG